MGNYTEKFSENVALLDFVAPQTGAAAINGAWVSVANFNRIVAKLTTGVISNTVTFRIMQAKTVTGTDAKVAKTDVLLPDTADGVNRWIELRTEEMDNDGGFKFVRIEILIGGTSALVSAELLGFVGRYEPVTLHSSLTVVR